MRPGLSAVTAGSSIAAQKPGIQPIAKMATPTAVPVRQRRSLRGTPRGTTRQTRDRQQGTDPGGLDYADYRAFLPAVGFRELTRTKRGWTRTPPEA